MNESLGICNGLSKRNHYGMGGGGETYGTEVRGVRNCLLWGMTS